MFKSDVQTYAPQNEDVLCINLPPMSFLHQRSSSSQPQKPGPVHDCHLAWLAAISSSTRWRYGPFYDGSSLKAGFLMTPWNHQYVAKHNIWPCYLIVPTTDSGRPINRDQTAPSERGNVNLEHVKGQWPQPKLQQKLILANIHLRLI